MYDSMIFYRSFYEAVKGLPPEAQGEIYSAIFAYGLDGIEPELDGIGMSIFTLIKPQIDANNRRKENGKKGGIYGKLGGRPRKEKPQENPKETPKKPQENPKKTPNVNVNVNANVNVNDNVNLNDKSNIKDISTNKDIDNNKVNTKEKNTKKEKPVYYPNDEVLNKAFDDFINHRKLMKKPMGDRAIELAMKELEKLSSGDNDLAVKIINQSIFRGWQGLFELKEDGKTSPINSHQAYIDRWRDA